MDTDDEWSRMLDAVGLSVLLVNNNRTFAS